MSRPGRSDEAATHGGACAHPAREAGIFDRSGFIRANLRVVPVPFDPRMRLYAAHPGSGLRRLADAADRPPYWAYLWAGGAALVQLVMAHPGLVSGCRVLDLGAGSGVVAIAAGLAGASQITASEIDPNGRAAIALNAALNGVVVTTVCDLIDRPPPAVDIVLVGDLFYDAELASRVVAFLDRCLDAGIEVLVGDPGRAPLPLHRLRPVASYPTADFADGTPRGASGVYRFHRDRALSDARVECAPLPMPPDAGTCCAAPPRPSPSGSCAGP